MKKVGSILVAVIVFVGVAWVQDVERITVKTMPPVVVKTVPKAGETAVDPNLKEIRVTFSKDMLTEEMWAWVQISKENFPKITGKIHYLKDKRTCVAPVKLEPGRTYAIWFNQGKFDSFRDENNSPAIPYLLVFETRGEMKVTSPAFEDGGRMAMKYTGAGANISPPLKWENVPEGTRSFVLICYDVDHKFYHWVLFNIPAEVRDLPEGVPRNPTLKNGARHAKSDFPEVGYLGPSPPPVMHTYLFRIYALDTTLDIPAGVSRDTVLNAMGGHILAEGHLKGRARM